MKGLFLFIKNNRIIYKISIVGILILMLISVMQINPENIKKKSVSGDLVEKDYAIMFGVIDGHAVFLDSINWGYIDEPTLTSLGISYEGLDGDGYHVIRLNNTNFKSTSNMGLMISDVNVNIVLADGTTNKISSSYNAKANEFYGIVNWGGTIKITGNGTLETNCYNLEKSNESGDNCKTTCAISASSSEDGSKKGKVIIESGTVTARANGAYGTAIYGEELVEISGGTVKAYGGDKGNTSGICAKKKINIENATVDVNVSSEDLWVSGICTSLDGHGDSITISNNAKVNVDVSTTNDTCSGSGISSGKLDINNSTVNVKMNGNSLAGLKTVYGIGTDYSEVPEGYSRGMLITASTITIKGDKCYDSAAIATYDSDADIIDSKINIDVKNSDKVVDKGGLFGIIAWKDRDDIAEGGNITITNSYVKDNVYANNGTAIFAVNDITINTSNIEAYADGEEVQCSVGLSAYGRLIVNSGRIATKGKTQAIHINSVENSLSLNTTSNSVKMIAVSTDYDIASVEEYNASSWSDYKYMEIGTIYDYYLKFDAAKQKMYKVTTREETTTNSEGQSVIKMVDGTTTELDNYEGLSIGTVDATMIAERGYDPSYNGLPILELDNMNFITDQLYGLYIEGDCVVNVKDGTSNFIEATSDNEGEEAYIIYSTGNVKYEGRGQLDLHYLEKASMEKDFHGIVSLEGEIRINSNIDMLAIGKHICGICSYGKCDIVGGRIKLDVNSDIVGAGINSESDNIEIKGESLVDIDIFIGKNGSQGMGMYSMESEVLISDNPTINLDMNCDGNVSAMFMGIVGVNVNINGGNINTNIKNGISANVILSFYNFSMTKGNLYAYTTVKDIPQGISDMEIYAYMMYRKGILAHRNIDVSGGSIDLNEHGNDITGIYCEGTYSETGGIVRVNVAGNNTIGVETASNLVEVKTAGTLEVTASKGKAMNIELTLPDNAVTISEARDSSGIVASPSTTSTTTYNYIRIEPTYFLRYSGDGLYKCTNINEEGTPVDSYPGVTIDSTSKTITLDGFNFATSNNYGLKLEGDTTIELAEGSNNSIVTDYTENGDGYAIYSDNKITIRGKGTLDVSCNSINKTVADIKARSKAICAINGLDIGDAVINASAKGLNAWGLYTENKLIINNSTVNIDVNGKSLTYGVAALPTVTSGNDVVSSIQNSRIKLNVVSETYEACGMFADASFMFNNVKCDYDVKVKSDEYSCYGIFVNNKVSFIDSEVNGNIEATKVNRDSEGYYSIMQIGIFAGHESRTISYKDAIEIDNTEVNLNVNSLVGYGLYTYYGGINISNDSSLIFNIASDAIDTSGTWGGVIYNYGKNTDEINISDSSIIMNVENIEDVYSIYSYYGGINIINSDVQGDYNVEYAYMVRVYNDSKNIYVSNSKLECSASNSNVACLLYSIGINSTITVKYSGIYFNASGDSIEGIYTYNGEVNISDSNIDFNLNAPRVYGIDAMEKMYISNSILKMVIRDIQTYAIGMHSDDSSVEIHNTTSDINILSEVEDTLISGISSAVNNVVISGGDTNVVIKGNKGAGILAGSAYVNAPENYNLEDINIIINNNANVTVTATGTSASGEMNGIQVTKGKSIVIEESTVTSNVKSVGNCSAIVIDKDTSSNINITSSDVTVKSTTTGTDTTVENYGIKSSGSVTVTGKLNSPSDKVNNLIMSINGCNITYGIYADQNITLKDMKLVDMDINMTNETDNSCAYGIYTKNKDVDIENCVITLDAIVQQGVKAILTDRGSIDIKNGSDIDIVTNGEVCGIFSSACNKDNPIKSIISINNSNIFIKARSGQAIYTAGSDNNDDEIIISDSDINIELGSEGVLGERDDAIRNNEGTISIDKSAVNIKMYSTKNAYAIQSLYKIEVSNTYININAKMVEEVGDGISCLFSYIKCSNLREGSTIDISGNNNSNIVGIKSTFNDVNIIGGDLTVKVNGGTVLTVDKLNLDKGGDMSTELIEGSTVYECTSSDIIEYPSINSLASYKYIKIGEVPTYYYRYTNNKIYKVSKDSIVTELNSTTWPTGCSITEDNKLELNEFNFVTTANKVIDIVGEANVLVSGINTIRNVCNTADYNYGIYSDSTINITSTGGTLNANYVNHNYLNESGKNYIALHSEGDISIISANITVQIRGENSLGIESFANLNIKNSTVVAKGGKSAIAVGSTGTCNVNGRVDASTTVDGELVFVKDSVFNTSYANYKHVEIIPKVISVNITWGDMDFKYSESDWNTSLHDYNTKIWSNNTTNGDMITVANAGSNVPVTASIAYNNSTGYEGITGTILQDKDSSTAFTNGTTISIGSSIYTYLALKGKLPSSATSGTIIGNVTVTISE